MHAKAGEANGSALRVGWQCVVLLGLFARLFGAPGCNTAQAQPIQPTKDGVAETPLAAAEFDDDPIGTDPNAPSAASSRTGAPAAAHRPTTPQAPAYGVRPLSHRATAGTVLSAVASVRETRHAVDVLLDQGLARISLDIRLENTAESRAEASLRLPVPDMARVTHLRACLADRCRQAVAHEEDTRAYDAVLLAGGSDDSAFPIAELIHEVSAGHTTLVLHAAPISSDAALSLQLTYVVPAPLIGGQVQLWLPPRGMDPRIAPAELTVHSPSLTSAGVHGKRAGPSWMIEPWSDALVSAQVAPNATTASIATHYPCGGQRCFYLWAAAPPAAHAPVDLIIALDASPSMEGPARSRIPAVVAAILEATPPGSTVRALAFAGRARALVAEPDDPKDISLQHFQPLLYDMDLGSATRLESAMTLALPWLKGPARRRRLMLIVGDGGLTTGDKRPFEQARRLGLEVSALDLSHGRDQVQQSPPSALREGVERTGGSLVAVADAARLTERSGHDQLLRAAVVAAFAPVVTRRIRARSSDGKTALPPAMSLRAGEQIAIAGTLEHPRAQALLFADERRRVSQAVPRNVAVMTALSQSGGLLTGLAPQRWLALSPEDRAHENDDFPAAATPARSRAGRCDPRGPAQRVGGLNRADRPIVLAYERPCGQTPSQDQGLQPGRGMPSSPLLEMLRKRILPAARACFRRDRAGRADYALRAVFAFELARREVVSAQVEGEIPEPLRECLLQAVDSLSVPFFSGTVRVTYPLRTQREALPVQIELRGDTARRLDAVLETEQTSSGQR